MYLYRRICRRQLANRVVITSRSLHTTTTTLPTTTTTSSSSSLVLSNCPTEFLVHGAGNVINGAAVARVVREEVHSEVLHWKEHCMGRVPGLATLIVGNRADSVSYVQQKRRFASKIGMQSFAFSFDANAKSTTQDELVDKIRELNANENVHGILVQLPLPNHMDERAVLEQVAPEKDVDGFHPENMGLLAMRDREPRFVPCTPRGILELLDRCGIAIDGRDAVVIGRSNIVGLPAALALMRRNATVQVCHRHTKDLSEKVLRADILISAAGCRNLVKRVKPGAVVIDVGNNAVNDPSTARGYRFVGDVDFEECIKEAGAITPVPGGVGPMTIAMLLHNTLLAFKRQNGLEIENP